MMAAIKEGTSSSGFICKCRKCHVDVKAVLEYISRIKGGT